MKIQTIVATDYQFPFRKQCQQCADEQLHHHTGERTKGMPHEGGPYYCWCLDEQPPE
jgi:hypothetical protein